jgi:hypothetical protein
MFKLALRYLFSLEPSYRNKVFGEPNELRLTLASKKTENIIQICLNNNHVKNVTPKLIDLVRMQLSINSANSNEELLADDDYKNAIKSRQQQKESLSKRIKVSQEILDVYISYLPSDL